MKTYETLLKEYTTVKIRVEANSQKEAEDIFKEFMNDDPGYLADELDLNGTKEWFSDPFKETVDDPYVEAATITKCKDGSFEAEYKGYVKARL